jgi:hypothetical protein
MRMMFPIHNAPLSAVVRLIIALSLLATISISLDACAGDGGGNLEFGGNPLWRPPAHISDDRPN